jgi:protein-L-isoaspartate(D-aspartate) O-methyltransferase
VTTIGKAAQPTRERAAARRSEDEIARRLEAGEPFHLATLLQADGVDRHPVELLGHLGLSFSEQRALLVEALIAGGAAREVAAAVVEVPRHLLVSGELRLRAYLDEFHAAKSGSGLTPPSLVAAMLQRLQLEPGSRVLELGVGSGFHALAALRLGAAEVVGVEADGEVLRVTKERLSTIAEARALRLVHGAEPGAALASAPFDRVYVTYAHTRPLSALLPLLADGGLVQAPRPVLPHEFAHEPLLAAEREKYGTFERFFESWQRNLCLTTYRREGGQLRVLDKLFALQFVGQRDELLPARRRRDARRARG